MVTVLIVEDDPDIRAVLKTLLDKKYIVLECGDGKEGLRLAETFYVNLIITDLALPGVTGLALLKTLQATNKKTKIIVITALSVSKEAEESLRELGALAVFRKPIDLDELLATVNKLVAE